MVLDLIKPLGFYIRECFFLDLWVAICYNDSTYKMMIKMIFGGHK